MEIKRLSERFYQFSMNECKGSSPLYEALALSIAEDPELLTLSSHAQEGQPVPNLLLAAVHYLLLDGEDHPLRDYYPSIVSQAKQADGAYPVFKDFCRSKYDDIRSLVESKRVQTNEVRRCTYLYPVFSRIYQRVKSPLAMIEIGTSSGLQLLWDRYAYSYGDDQLYGNKESALHLNSRVRKGELPLDSSGPPPVQSRLGIDLNIVDLNQEESYRWLKALIWPEHTGRQTIFDQAVEQFHQSPPSLVEGDGVANLGDIADHIPKESILCIFHTHVANQISEDRKHQLMETVNRIGQDRDVFHIYNNMWDRQLHIDFILNGCMHQEVIGETDGHGRWFDWNAAF